MKNIIRQVINEYLTRNAMAVKKDLDANAEDAKRSAAEFVDDGEDIYNTYLYNDTDYRHPTGNIIKNQWLVHGTSFVNALQILENGFYGYNDLKIGLTHGCAHEGGSVAFAFPLDRTEDVDNSIVRYALQRSNVILIFQANGFEEFYIPDKKTEVVFDISSVHNMFLVFRSEYINGKYVYCIPLKNGRFINIQSDEFLNDNKLYEWVRNNYMTYKNAIKTNLSSSDYPSEYIKNITAKAEAKSAEELEKRYQALPKQRKLPPKLRSYGKYRADARDYRKKIYGSYNKLLDDYGVENIDFRNRMMRNNIGDMRYYKNRSDVNPDFVNQYWDK